MQTSIPEYRGQRLEAFLKKIEDRNKGKKTTIAGNAASVPWKGYAKTSPADREKTLEAIRTLVTRKAKNLERVQRDRARAMAIIGRHKRQYVSTAGKTYILVYSEYVWIPGEPRWKDSVTGRFTKFDSKKARDGEMYTFETGGRWFSTRTGRYASWDDILRSGPQRGTLS